jgi:hypothetical protein
MAIKRIPRPRDPLALAKLIGDIATGQVVDEEGGNHHSDIVELETADERERAVIKRRARRTPPTGR